MDRSRGRGGVAKLYYLRRYYLLCVMMLIRANMLDSE